MASKKNKRRATQKKTGRMHLRLDEGLVEQVHAYAKRQHTTATALVISFFTDLLKVDAERDFPEAEQV